MILAVIFLLKFVCLFLDVKFIVLEPALEVMRMFKYCLDSASLYLQPFYMVLGKKHININETNINGIKPVLKSSSCR